MKEIIIPFDSDKIPGLIAFIENDPKFCPEKYLKKVENVFTSQKTDNKL